MTSPKAVFLTGATGYIGSYVANNLLRDHDTRLALLVRADDTDHAHRRLWRALQLHMDFDTFARLVSERVDIYLGDLTAPGLGLAPEARQRAVESIESIVHCAASLNRKSSKACFNTNLRGTLAVIDLCRAAHAHHCVRRFSDVSTVAVAGHRHHETVAEADAIDWQRSDYDPYARTKKFCEHMLHELLPDVPQTIFRPSIVLGDSRFPETTQFDMVRAFVFLGSMPFLPFEPHWRADIVPADFVGRAIATIHRKDAPQHDIYHLSAGVASLSFREIVAAVDSTGVRRRKRQLFLPRAGASFGAVTNLLGSVRRRHPVFYGASLLKVFWPYLTYNTVFDNRRICDELGESPAPFSRYAAELYRFARDANFAYDYKPWPAGVILDSARPVAQRRGTG